ncbi:MAG: hypothetical protein A2086_02400 [Spirochaetes bacterium GWD1_27_9]|nr:MAG: hypothetical protein A2Z98_08265 [Spirochaetes bacterium GWB1_27_13]OHD27764.1 MAG: hypothetical protein A2Y34_08995 [Spirochaetes bacterium GWC1_27_15]OHD31581.1 MAG: hypothetical protein A2086_02400 [Spirochaetes bacterium GWD1_27_9]
MSNQINKFKKKYFILIFAISFIVILQIFISLFIENRILKKLTDTRKKELNKIWDKYLEQKFGELGNYVDGYSCWKDLANAIISANETKELDSESKDTWLAGNANKNDIVGIISFDNILVKDGIEIEKLDSLFSSPILKEIYKTTNLNQEARNNNYIINIKGNTLLLVASPICDDDGNPMVDGIEIFGRILKEKDIDDIKTFLNSNVSLTNATDTKSYLTISVIDSFDNENTKYLNIDPLVKINDLVFNPLLTNLFLQVIITIGIILTFLFLLNGISKLFDETEKKSNTISKLSSDFISINNSFKSVSSFYNKFHSTINKSETQIKEMQTSLNTVQNQSKEQATQIENTNKEMSKVLSNINNITNHLEHNFIKMKEDSQLIEEMQNNMSEIKKVSSNSKEISIQLNNYSLIGEESIKLVIDAIAEISDSSNKIEEIITIINNISEKTNLLSINASIEAAHSGEHGRGFFIVANEIRKLSQNTHKNTANISAVIKKIVEQINQTSLKTKEAMDTLTNIMSSSTNNQRLSNEINFSVEEQYHSLQEIVQSTVLMVQITEEIKDSMLNQKNLIETLANTMTNLEEFSLETKDKIISHIDYLNSVLQTLVDIKRLSDEGSSIMGTFSNFIDKFKTHYENSQN